MTTAPLMTKVPLIAVVLSIALAGGAAPVEAVPLPLRPSQVDSPRDASARVDGSTRITLLAGIPRDSDRLAKRARAVSTPASEAYRDFGTLKETGRAYGGSSKSVSRLRSTADRLGISVEVDPTRIFARLTATVATWERVLGVGVTYTPAPKGSASGESGPLPYATYYFLDAGTGNLVATPKALARVVEEFIPAATVYDPEQDIPGPAPLDLAARSILPIDDTTPDPWPSNNGSPLGPACDAPAVSERQLFTPRQTRDAYGTSEVLRKGASGSAARVTIVSLGGGFAESDVTKFADCFGVSNPAIKVTLGTGVPREIVSASPETHLDLQTVMGALADARRIDLVQAVNDDYDVGTIDGFARALDRNGKATSSPDAVSLSYDGCELNYLQDFQDGVTGYPAMPLLEDVFAMAGLVGTALFIAAGDAGSSLCQIIGDYGTTAATVSYPGSSPWVTVVGGTRLRLGEGNARKVEVTWNDVRYGVLAAGTGGYSRFFDRPWYQPGVFSADQRTVPDVAALAAVYPGWPLAYGGEIQSVGGTSGSSPFTAANIALLSARERARGRPAIGFANPWLYSQGAGAFYDIRDGDNQVPVTVPGEFVNVPACCQATRGFDLVSGLGAPRFEQLLTR
jgi:subtilase family serine protease